MSSAEEVLSESIEEINILLMGESGVGKSTFINSCINYLENDSLKEASQNELRYLIPAKLSILNNDYEKISFQVGTPTDETEQLIDGKAATQDVKAYVFPVSINNKKIKVRFIDTPGIGDGRGVDQDKRNCDLILSYLAQLKHIHAFCLLLKPFDSRLSVFLNYCINQILSRLEKSAVDNVIFVFTNTRGQNFTPGDTFTSLKVLIGEIKNKNGIIIPVSRKNMFCFDNESFKVLAALSQGIPIDDYVFGTTAHSFKHSSEEFWRMISYITQVKPHDLKKTISVNDARTMASQLSQPLTEIVQLIEDNINKLNQHTKELSEAKITKKELEKKMYTPQIEMVVKELPVPQTVCTDSSCTSSYLVNGIRKIHYKEKCCPNCLCYFVPAGIIGNPALFICSAFSWGGVCRSCEHSITQHVHIYYETQVIEKKMDESMLPEVTSQEDLVKEKEKLIKKLKTRQQEFEGERTFILQSCVAFDRFLKEHSVTPVGEPIRDYLRYQIHREESYGSSDDDTVLSLKRLLEDYEREKQPREGENTLQTADYSPEAINERKRTLLKLKHFGPKISELYSLHQSGSTKKQKHKEIYIGKWFKKLLGKSVN